LIVAASIIYRSVGAISAAWRIGCLAAIGVGALANASETAVPPAITRYVGIDNVCAWPNLVTLRDGTIVALIHNRPSHGQMEGDVECWASSDGSIWEKRGHPAPNEPRTVRMNVGAGLAANGDLLVLCSGWTDEKQEERPKQAPFRDAVIPTWVCRSRDGGRTWTQIKRFAPPENELHTSMYAGELAEPAKSSRMKSFRAWHFRSDDDGTTWRPASVIGMTHNETSLFHLGGRNWLAAARIEAMDIFRSSDDGATWQTPLRVTGRNEINGHLLRLADGRILLSYGSRVKGQFGVLAKISNDEGRTWGEPIRLANSLEQDCGYPSSVQRSDGRIVTAYYAKRVENHERYHMGVALWQTPRAGQ
jgi:Neuraminidase (sialidase)